MRYVLKHPSGRGKMRETRSEMENSEVRHKKFLHMPSGCDYVNFPSMMAKGQWYHVFNAGEALWPPGSSFGHPISAIAHLSRLYPKDFHDTYGWLLHYVIDGRLVHHINQQRYVVEAGNAVFMDLRDSLFYKNEERRHVRFLYLHFDSRTLPMLCAELGIREDPVVINLPAPRVLETFQRILDLIASEPPWYEAGLSAEISILLSEICKTRPKLDSRNHFYVHPALGPPLVRRALAAMCSRYQHRWSIKELSALSNCSTFHFCRLFKQVTRYRPMDYLNRYRIEHSKTLLQTTRDTIQEIARQVGFVNPKYFSRLFQRFERRSPADYRRKMVGDESQAIRNQMAASDSNHNPHRTRGKGSTARKSVGSR